MDLAQVPAGRELEPEPETTLKDYTVPTVNITPSCIVRPAVEACHFELKPAYIQIVPSFHGLSHEDPKVHIHSFLEICDIFKIDGVSPDVIQLRLFPFSLKDKAKAWLISLPVGSITTWAELANKFLQKFFPPTKRARLSNDIMTFTQRDGELFSEAWERFRDLLMKCPHHEISIWLQLQTFYQGLLTASKTMFDAASGGAIMEKRASEALEIINAMASSSDQWESDRGGQRMTGLHEIDAANSIK